MRRHTLPVLAATSVFVLAAAGCDLMEGSAGPYLPPAPPTSGGLDSNGLDSNGLDSGGLISGGSDAGGLDAGGSDAGGLDAGGTSGGPSVPETYNPNAMGEVVGNQCQYDESTYTINYQLSIQNVSTTQAFRYQIMINYSGGDTEFADDPFGSKALTVTVAPGGERKMTVAHSWQLSKTKKQWYRCQITSATKVPAT